MRIERGPAHPLRMVVPVKPLAILSAALLACNAPEPRLDATQTLTLGTEWKFTSYCSGQYTDREGNVRLIFSGDLNTYLVMRVFDQAGHSLYDIPLKDAVDALDEINSCVLLAPDSLFVMEEHGPDFVIVDRSGKVVRKGSLAQALCATPEDRYEVSGYFNGIANYGRDLYLSAVWWGACGETGWDPTLTKIQYIQRQHLQGARKCRMAKLHLASDTASLVFGGCNILPHLADTPRYSSGGIDRVIANGKLFLFSAYAPYVLQVDTGTLEVLHKIPIALVHGELGDLPPPLTQEDLKKDGPNVRGATKARVVGFAYDKPSGHYVITALHGVPEDTPEGENGIDRPWSLIVLDSAFNKISEQVVPGKLYRPNHLLSTESGTWVHYNITGRAGITGPKVFHRLILP